MKLYEYYKLVTREDGKTFLKIIPDPLPQDGYSYEPLAYTNDDNEYDEEYVAKLKLPFTGVDTNFSGDHGDIGEVKIVQGVDDVPMEVINDFISSNPYSYKPSEYIFYRTGIYFHNEDYTGFDMVYFIVLD